MTPHRPPAVVRHGAGYHLFLWTAFPLIGAALGLVLSMLPGWLTTMPEWVFALPFLPGPDKVEILARLSGPILTAVLVGLGVAGGGLVALSAYGEMITVEVADDTVRVITPDRATEVARDRFGAAFLDGKELVLLDAATAEVVRAATDHGAKRLRAAFEAHGYVWADGDPHGGDYRRWLDGTPDLDGHVQALLRTRRTALENKDAEDAAGLRAELARHGVVVRDEEGRQHWRRTPASPSDGDA
ncbi:hypothetical protein PWG71_11450 [Nocardiopsis sp. N85]|uniref:YqeB family protein n=1 Tax=Nocardiopsis sp. N85 TaxID=3029400 RepID=UPI00237F3B68|nr:hypothetical protein [Nocardiopsis sp. N85]MDE3722006.1 hypothetical protein [Nocardiopsis sp. N85]